MLHILDDYVYFELCSNLCFMDNQKINLEYKITIQFDIIETNHVRGSQ